MKGDRRYLSPEEGKRVMTQHESWKLMVQADRLVKEFEVKPTNGARETTRVWRVWQRAIARFYRRREALRALEASLYPPCDPEWRYR